MTNRFKPGQVWNDTDGKPIQAHGGGILYDNGTYYWYGENKDGPTSPSNGCEFRIDVVGVSCYSSKDLYHWRHEGVVLPAEQEDQAHDLHISKVVERPKVIYNGATGQFVMWMHIDSEDYTKAKAGVAVSHSPTGPFRYLGSVFPNGVDSRDMTLFKDDDDQAYLVHSSDWNKTLYISKLTPDYLSTAGEFVKCFIDQSREAPAVFKRNGKYYMLSSSCTGWYPNVALYAEAASIMGRWELKDNPCEGSLAKKTFLAQSTFVLPVQGLEDAFIFMADRWNPDKLSDSRYVWLPIRFGEDGMVISWMEEWDLGYFQSK
ncbi:MAG: family 43 glycosylhydrolase [Gorillibacterium sp.]|nr:family 43 glycosylhydrolase [Gorillibacterium sp.]